MKIPATQQLEVEISDYTRKSITIDYLLEKFDWNSNYFIDSKDGFLKEAKEYCSSHSWTEKEFVRLPTENDHSVWAILKALRALS